MRAILSPVLLPIVFFMSSCRDEVPAAAGAPASEPVLKKGGSPRSDGDFVGLSEAAGASLAGQRELRHRVVSVDGELRPTTRDYRPDRVNFELEGGKIVKVTRG